MLDWPRTSHHFGEKFKGFYLEAAKKLSAIDGFPSDAIVRACEEFEENHYSLPFRAGKTKIHGTRLHAEIYVRVSVVDTRRFIRTLLRGKDLHQVELKAKSHAEVMFSRHLPELWVKDGRLFVSGTGPSPIRDDYVWSPEEVDLSDFGNVLQYFD